MRYKSYEAKVEYDEVDEVFKGRILHINDNVVFETAEANCIQALFETAVDSYLDRCEKAGREPDPPTGRILSISQLEPVINKIQEKVQQIPREPQHQLSLEVIHALLEIINSYAFWVEGLKRELVTLQGLNTSQATALKARGIIT